MSVHSVLGRNVIWWDQEHQDIYWESLASEVKKTYNDFPYNDKENVAAILKLCQAYFIGEFLKVINEDDNLAFFSFVFEHHETSIGVYLEQLSGKQLDNFSEPNFATYRRILKLILEQACNLHLIAGKDIPADIQKYKLDYKCRLERLMFLGEWIYGFADYVAEVDLMGEIFTIDIHQEFGIQFLIQDEFAQLKEVCRQDYDNHSEKAVVDLDGVKELGLAIKEHLKIDYAKAGAFLSAKRPIGSFINLDALEEQIANEFEFDINDVKKLYSGLTISNSNNLPLFESVINPQKDNRYIYRPILELNTNMGRACLVSFEKWHESVTALVSNAIPWGIAPLEWMEIEGFKKYVQQRNSLHDAILEDPAEKLFKTYYAPYSRNVKSFTQRSGRNLKCDIAGVGEMDFVFLHPEKKEVYMMECKHNRSRFDMVSWRKEYSNFEGYDKKLNEKRAWLIEHKKAVLEHFEIECNLKNLKAEEFEVKTIYLVNVPNFYMYNGLHTCLTLTTLETLLDDDYKHPTIDIDTMKNISVERPYFDNLHAKLEEA